MIGAWRGMGDPRVASPILRRPARFGLAASDRGYAGCELRRIPLLGTWVNKLLSKRLSSPGGIMDVVANPLEKGRCTREQA